MPQPTALLIGKIDHAGAEWEALRDVATLRQLAGGDRAGFLRDCAAGAYDGVVAVYRTFDSVALTGRWDAELVGALPATLRFVCHNGAGYDQIDVAACSARGIAVAHTPQAVNAATANVAMMLILGALRRSWEPEAALRAGRWRGDMALGRDPEGKVLGILGMGGIGTALAQRAAGFEMQLVYHNTQPVAEAANPARARFIADKDEFLRACDVVSVHLPLSEHTRHFLGDREFALLRPGAVVVNTARGAVVDEAALVRALESGRVAAAGLDVFEHEPEVHEGLRTRGDVVLFPHIGTATWETQHKMESLVIQNVRTALENGTLVTQVPEQRSGGKFPLANSKL